MEGRLGAVLAQRATAGFVGRRAELSELTSFFELDGEAVVCHVHGLAGIGKSALLGAALDAARDGGAAVVRVDCRGVEPTARGLLHELGGGDVAEVAARLCGGAERVILALDNYEVFGLVDTWLRQVFVPALNDDVRVVLTGRGPPSPGWVASPEWRELARSVPLQPLGEEDALALLAQHGFDLEPARRINRVARGHPLALRLAASAVRDRPELAPDDAATHGVVAALTNLHLAGISDAVTRQALEATSVVRRATRPLLAALLPHLDPQDVFQRLEALPFVDMGRDGLLMHDAVQQAIAASVKAADPGRHRGYRRAAWSGLRAEAETAGTPELWRCTADMLYLIENPVVREAFFPTGAQRFAVEPATPEHEGAIQAIAKRSEPPRAIDLLMGWWADAPDAFSVVRDREGRVVGFYVMFQPSAVRHVSVLADPVTREWLRHLREHPAGERADVLFLRRWLGDDGGEGPSAIQAACWLDIKRSYMAMRPRLRRVYTTVQDLPAYAPVVTTLGFRPITGALVELDGVAYHSAVLDFGPASVDGWLARLVGEELGVRHAIAVDADLGEMTVEDRRIALTPLEFGVIRCLAEHRGRVVTRLSLLREVWGHDFAGGSNVVDSVIRSLRKKLGDRASFIETVRGFGYRLREEEPLG